MRQTRVTPAWCRALARAERLGFRLHGDAPENTYNCTASRVTCRYCSYVGGLYSGTYLRRHRDRCEPRRIPQ